MNRRRMLKLAGGSLGALGAIGVAGRYTLLPPRRSTEIEPVGELAQRLFLELDADTRASACVDYDHPLRQYHNRGVWTGGARVWGNLGWGQRKVLVDLMHAGLSPAGRERVPRQYFLNWPGIHMLKLLICGDPSTGPYQVILSGPHLNLRIGGVNREGVAFGGPQVYGDQRGDSRPGLPGNTYRYQLEIADRLFGELSPAELERSTYPKEPVQTQIELRGTRSTAPGLHLEDVSPSVRQTARKLVDSILENYPDVDRDYALACIEANGGVDALSLSRYEEGEDGPSGPNQIFRLEGPAAVFHYRGHPHLHAFVNIGMDGEAPLSVGESLGVNPNALEGDGVKALFERAMVSETGADVGYYDRQSVVGSLRTGEIRTGDIYNLESWQNRIAILEIEGGTLRPKLLDALEARGLEPDPSRSVKVATTGYAADEFASEQLGRVVSRVDGGLLRDATIEHVRQNGFA